MMTFVEEAEKIKKNIVGGNALGQVTNIDMEADSHPAIHMLRLLQYVV